MPSVLLTGVGRRRGIAAGVAAGLAADGWDLALTYWPQADAEKGLPGAPDDPQQLADELRSAGRRVLLLPGDLGEVVVPEMIMKSAVDELGPLDALLMCHAHQHNSTVLDTTVESFDRHYAVNIRATWLLLAEFARQLPNSGGAAVALTGDHTIGNLPYGVTKAGLDRLVLAAAHELADRQLRTNVINPGPIDTGWMSEEVRAACLSQQPSGRMATPADTANLVRFLLSEQGAWINGQLLYSNGGWPKGHLPI
ncbi:MAG TPA: SDR family oxidoreductase [Microlunatus sp.]